MLNQPHEVKRTFVNRSDHFIIEIAKCDRKFNSNIPSLKRFACRSFYNSPRFQYNVNFCLLETRSYIVLPPQ